MIPGTYNIDIFKGDTYHGPLITLPSLEPFGGPADLTTATITAEIRVHPLSAETLATFTVDVVDGAARQIRLILPPAITAALSPPEAVWDLQVTQGSSGWVGTPLAGKVAVHEEVTR